MIKQSDIDRFNLKIEKLESGCWVFTGCKSEHGYGAFRLNKKAQRAHRVSWMIHNGEIPSELLVLHKCDNPPCIRIDHLYLGDFIQNAKDMMDRNRQTAPKITYVGEQSVASRMTDSKAIEIKYLLEQGMSGVNIAKKVGVSIYVVSSIKTRKSWKHLNIKNLDDVKTCGDRCGASKLKEKEVIKIIKLMSLSSINKKEIAIMFDVTIKTIENIHRKKTWKHVQ